MMTIIEYLKITRKREGPSSYSDETDIFYQQLQQITEDSGIEDIDLIITNTCKVQCSTVYLDNMKHIIWDLSYWGIIEDYLNSIELYLDNNQECAQLLYNFLLYRTLRYRVNDKQSRIALSKLEKQLALILSDRIPENINGFSNIKLYLDFFKLFTFIHELCHIQLKENEIIRLSALKEFDDYVQTIGKEKNLWFSHKSAYQDIDFSDKINIEEAIKQYVSSDDMKIEAICDYYALDSLANSFSQFEKALNITREQFLSDFYCLKEAIIGFYNDVLYYQEYIERLAKHKTEIDEDIIRNSSKGFYNLANMYMARESLFNPLFLIRCYLKYNCMVSPKSSSYFDLYNRLNHNSLRQNYLKDYINYYNELLSKSESI